VAEVLVVALSLAFARLMLLPEMRAARLAPLERVQAHELRQPAEVRQPPGSLERFVQRRFLVGQPRLS
jgi:hypothetical protein